MQIKLIVDVVIVVKGKSAHDFHCLATQPNSSELRNISSYISEGWSNLKFIEAITYKLA